MICKFFGHKRPVGGPFSMLRDYDTYLCKRCKEHLFSIERDWIFGGEEHFFSAKKEYAKKKHAKDWDEACYSCVHYIPCSDEYGRISENGDDCRAIAGTHFCLKSWQNVED
jgi:hypothetical protein